MISDKLPLRLRRFLTEAEPPESRHEALQEHGTFPDGTFPDDPGPNCWLIDQDKVNSAGYGQMKWNGKTWNTHRLVWHLLVERLPFPGKARAEDGTILDHICEQRRCCNPAHLERISQSENVKRGARHRSPEPEQAERPIQPDADPGDTISNAPHNQGGTTS